MDTTSGGEKDGGDNEATCSLGAESLHDHSDLLIPNPSFISSPASVSSSTSSMMMNITSPMNSDNDLQNRQMMDYQMTSPVGEDGTRDSQMDHSSVSSLSQSEQTQPDSSPPNVIVDDSPLQPCMDRNKQSLKVKLLMRRPMNQLVEQGILPPPKTPAAFAGQRVRLERARMGDLLKAKIQQRPARQELIRQHILEDTDSRVAPSLAEKQRMLKRARLADSLNDHLIHRPGPLELVQKNILHAPDADIEKAIKDGIVSFKATSEGHIPGPSLPCKYTVNEDDSSSDISSPAGTPDASSSGHTTEANTPISKQLSDPAICLPSPAPVAPTTSTSIAETCEITTVEPAKIKSEIAVTQSAPQIILAAPQAIVGQAQQLAQAAAIFQVTPTATSVIPPPPPLPTSSSVTKIPPPPPLPQTIVLSDGAVRELLPQLQSAGFQLAAAHVQKPSSSSQSSSSSFGKSRSSKKSSKGKSQPKARTIKFHEYKGPSSCQQKGGSSSNGANTSLTSQSAAESSYELLLKQQQLFLQWQLEWQHKYPQILLPAAPKPGTQGSSTSLSSGSATLSSFPVTAIPASLCTHLLSSNNQQTSSQQSTSSPATITVASAISNENSNPRPITLAPKMTEIAPKPPSMTSDTKTSSIENVPSPASSTSSSVEKSVSVKSLNMSNISDWKVNDLKAALKKRSLPVSGSKSQLVERLKAAVAKDANNGNDKSVAVKMEVTSADENSNEALMDVGSGTSEEATSVNKSENQQNQTQPATVVIGSPGTAQPQAENNNISILDLANGKLNGVPISLQNILSLLGISTADRNIVVANNNNPTADNNLKNNTAQTVAAATAKVFGQLPISTVLATSIKPAPAKSAETSASSSNSQNPTAKPVDENMILEQQKQILELQKALRISQQQLQLQQLAQQKDPKQGGPQKHRLVLQQHIQHKLQQQAIANQLQNLIQLQTQQAEQKKLLQQQQLQQQQQQQQQQNAQTQPQLVLISNGNNGQPVANVGNNVLPLTIVSQQSQQPSQQVDLSNHWLPPTQQTEQANKTSSSTNMNLDDLVKNESSKDAPIKLESEEDARRKGVKSQMVDDVLEILIRNGELPPSAAQDPHAKAPTLPSSSTTTSRTSSISNASSQAPPPPPPLPPPSFSVMLPTSIPFSRHHATNSTDFLSFGSLGGRSSDPLSKDAQEILRICEDLSNFGKSREAEAAQAAANARLENGSINSSYFTENSGPNAASDNKDFDLSATHHHNHNSLGSGNADSMDIGFGDTHSVSLHSTENKAQPTAVNHHQYQNSPFDSGTFSFSHPNSQTQHSSTFKSSHDHHNSFMGDDELLPVSLDMQMDTDYSDWLDTLLPDPGAVNNGSSASNSSTGNLFHHHQPDTALSENKLHSGKRHENNIFNQNNNLSNSNSQNSSSNGPSLFGSLLDDTHHHQQPVHHSEQRDPLLSSRSFTTRVNNSSPFIGEMSQQQHNNSFIFSPHQNNQQHPLLIFHNSPMPSQTTMMDTDFDELTSATPPTTTNTKKSENILSSSSHNNVITEMPSTNNTIITTTGSINDNFLWDFAM